MARLPLAAVLLAAVVVAGCSSGSNSCERDAQCESGEICGPDDTCVRGCRSDDGCASGVCLDGTCQAGTRCSFTSECATGQQCGPQGVCIAQCQADADCGAAATCAEGTCVPAATCAVDGDCTGGERCGPAATCTATCGDDAACGEGRVCSNFLCVEAQGGELNGVVRLAGAVTHDGVAVTLRGPATATAVTDLLGQYRFRGLKPGLYAVTVRADATAEGELHREVSVPRTGAVTLEALELTPVGSISGRVELSQSGEPAPNVQVFATSGGNPAVTDATGAYVLDAVRAGSTRVVAFLQGHAVVSSTELTVTRGSRVEAPALGLVPVGSVGMGFVTEPERSAYVLRTYRYTAVATTSEGAVTYALAHGPEGMKVSAEGVVTWTPLGRQLGEHLVSVEARVAGMVAYQTFVLTVRGPFTVAAAGAVRGVASAGGHAWVATSEGVRRLGTSPLTFPSDTGRRTGTAQLAWGNAAKVASASLAKGALGGVYGAFGPLTASWSSAQVTNVVPLDSATLAGARLEGGVGTAAEPLDVRTIGSATPLDTGTITAVADGRRRPTSITAAESGLATAVSQRELTDSAATFAAGALVGRCLVSATGNSFNIASNTATAITVSDGDLRNAFTVGTRYFIAADYGCSTVSFVLRDDGQTFTTSYGQGVAIYLPGSHLGTFPVNTTSGTRLYFHAPLSSAGTLFQAGVQGTYLLGRSDYYSGGVVPVTIEDGSGPFSSAWAGSMRVAIDGVGSNLITAATSTTVTLEIPAAKLLQLRAGLTWVRVDASSRSTVRLELGTVPASITAEGSVVVDDLGVFAVAAVAATSIDVLAPWTTAVSAWPLRRVAPAVDASGATRVLLTLDTPLSGFTTGHYLRDESGYGAAGRISRLSGSTAEVLVPGCYYCAPDLDVSRGWIGKRFVVTRDSYSYSYGSALGSATLQSASVPADQLTGRLLALPGRGEEPVRILSATGSSVVLEGPLDSIRTLTPATGAAVCALSRSTSGTDLSSNYWRDVFALRIEDSGAAFTAGELVGLRIFAGNSAVGTVTANVSTALEANVIAEGLRKLAPGTRISFATPASASSSGCDHVRITGTLGVPLEGGGPYDRLLVGSTAVAVIQSVSGDAFTARVCVAELGTLTAALGSRAALANGGKVAVTLEAAGAFAGVAPNSRVVAFPPSGELTSAAAQVLSADRVRFEATSYEWGGWAALPASTPFVVADSLGRVGVNVTLDRALPGYADGGVLTLLTEPPALVRVSASSETQFTFRVLPGTAHRLGVNTAVATTGGAVVQLEDAAATFPAGLHGRAVIVGGQRGVITSNTGTTLTAWLTTLPREGDAAYELEGLAPGGALAATADGRAFAASTSGVVFELGEAGVLSHRGALGTTRHAVTAVTLPPRTGTLDTSGAVLVDTTASWTPDEWAGSTVELDLLPGPARVLVEGNDANTLRLADAVATGPVSYRLEAWTLDVTGGGLTPGALAGRTLYVDGARHLVRSNTADRIRLVPARGPALAGLVTPGKGEAYAYGALGSAGAGGALAVTTSGELFAALPNWGALLRATEHGWVAVDERDTTAPVATGTISAISGNTVQVAGAAWSPGEHVGRWLVTPLGPFAIWDNTADRLWVSRDYYTQRNPVAGEPFAIYVPTAPRSVRDVATDGDDLHVASGDSVHRRVGGVWSRHTAASTESSAGANDGLPCGDLRRVRVVAPSTVWIGSSTCGASRWNGTAYERVTRTSTESAPGAADGLPSDGVLDFAADATGTWFATQSGAAKRTGAAWTPYGTAQGYPAAASVVTAGDRVFFGTADGLLEPLP